MTIKRLDHISVVVEDLQAASAFFSELGLEKEGEAALEGEWVTASTPSKVSKWTSL